MPAMNMNTSQVGLPLILFGVVFLGVGVLLFVPSYSLVRSGKDAAGHVVDVYKSMGIDDTGADYAPIVAFTAPDGKEHRFTSSLNTDKRPTIGEPVSVVYDPANPDHAVINSFFLIYGFPGIFAGIGVLSILVGCIALSISAWKK